MPPKNIKLTKFNYSIGRRLIIYILLFSSLVTLLGTSLQLYIEYSSDVRSIQNTLKQIESSYLQSISTSLWNINKIQANTLLNGILRLPDMQRLEIWQKGELFISAGKPAQDNIIQREFKLIYTYKGQDNYLGTLIATANLKGVYKRLLNRTAIILATQAIKTFLVSSFIFFLFHILVGRHLLFMANYTKHLNLALLNPSLKLKRKPQKNSDELEQLVQSINTMRSNLIHDIEVQKQAEEDLQSSNKRYQSLFHNSPVPLWEEDFSELYDYLEALKQKGITNFREYFDENPSEIKNCTPKVKILNVNQAALKLHDAKTRENLLGNLDKIFTEKSLDTFKEQLIALAHGQLEFEGEGEVKTLAGEPRQILLKFKIDKEQPDSIKGLLATQDITERKKAQEQFRLFKQVVDSATDAFGISTPEGLHWYQNAAFDSLFGKIGNDPPATLYCDKGIGRKVFETIMAGDEWVGEVQMHAADGRLLDILLRAYAYTDGNGRILGLVGVHTDMTETHRIEEQLQQSQKIEAIGTLAGGIAHDFNNMLAVITGNISYALSRFKKDDELYGTLTDVQEGAKQARTLTQQLLTFSKGGEPVKKTADINRLIKDAAQFVIRGAKTRIEFELSENLSKVDIDAGQINQVISNLVINANQAMPDGGIIYIKTENTRIETEKSIPLPDGQYIKTTVEDQGIGILEKHLSKIFDPFFTTKQKGNGLGLSTVYSIIQKHHGHITASSEIEKGTVFHIYIPASLKELEKDERILEVSHQGHGKILIMDDQEPILEMAGRILNRMGYETASATEGSLAVEIYKDALSSDNPFDLVILDLTVPGGMGGLKTIIELLKIDPDVKALVSSGYSNDPVMANFEDYGFCEVVPKPFTIGQLAEILNKISGEKG